MNEQMIEEYIQDSLSLVDETIDRLSSNDYSPKCVNAIFRCLHTIKGASGFVGLESMSHFVHQFEGCLKPWQESGRGLNKEEAQCILDGLRLTQEALVKTRDTTVPESQEFVDFINQIKSISHKYDQLNFAELETLFNDLKNVIKNDHEETYQKEMLLIGSQMKRLLEDIQSEKTFYQIPVCHNQIKSVKIGDTDITNLVKNQLEGLERVATQGESACKLLDLETLKNELNEIETILNKPGFLLSWDIVKDLCDMSPDVVEEAFRRFWDECIKPAASIEIMEEAEAQKSIESTDTEKAPESQQQVADVQAKQVKTEEKKEEYLRISSSALQQMTDSTGDLVADRNAFENLIQEMGTHVPARYRRYLQDNYSNLDKHVNALERQLNLLSNRQLNDVFRRLGPMVSSLSDTLGKKVDLNISGGEIEIPRDLLRSLNDPLVHIIRNSLDHGFELPEERKKIGKPAAGQLDIRAERNEDRLSINIQDDGKGIDPQVIRKKAIKKGLIQQKDQLDKSELIHMIFEAGFSTKDQVSDVSGRGVGMDVVRTAIESKGGRIFMDSEIGNGTVLDISLPLSEGHRTQDILLVKAGKQTYGIEYRCLREILDDEKVDIHAFRQKSFFEYRNDLLPYVNLEELFNPVSYETLPTTNNHNTGRVIVIEDEQGHMMACNVDQVYNKVKVVVIPFEHEFLKDNPMLRGSAVLGTGEPYLILDFRDVERILKDIILN